MIRMFFLWDVWKAWKKNTAEVIDHLGYFKDFPKIWVKNQVNKIID